MPRQPRLFARLSARACAAAVLACAASSHAAPPLDPDQGDAVLLLLQQKGLLPAAVDAVGTPGPLQGGFVRQLRDSASSLVLSAMNFLGVPYRRGGSSAMEGFDCSGFTRHVFALSLGMALPHRAEEQANAGMLSAIGRDELKPGDLVFFNTMRRTFSHVGIYIGEGRFIHSPRSGGTVRIEDMRQGYWDQRFNGARRADIATAAGP